MMLLNLKYYRHETVGDTACPLEPIARTRNLPVVSIEATRPVVASLPLHWSKAFNQMQQHTSLQKEVKLAITYIHFHQPFLFARWLRDASRDAASQFQWPRFGPEFALSLWLHRSGPGAPAPQFLPTSQRYASPSVNSPLRFPEWMYRQEVEFWGREGGIWWGD